MECNGAAISLSKHEGPQPTDVGWNDPPPVAFNSSASASLVSPLSASAKKTLANPFHHSKPTANSSPASQGSISPPVCFPLFIFSSSSRCHPSAVPLWFESLASTQAPTSSPASSVPDAISCQVVVQYSDTDKLEFIKDTLLRELNAVAPGASQLQIQKRIESFFDKLQREEISLAVLASVYSLCECIKNENYNAANDIHLSLMKSHFEEVSFWMVGMKKLISLKRK
eukprot:Sdes_comp16043_c0_seq4m5251